MDKPLTKWYCDVCGNRIEHIDDGYVIWKDDDTHKYHEFRIIHQSKCDLNDYPCSAELHEFLGENGLAYLFSMLSPGPIKKFSWCDVINMDEFVDFMRRVQTPFYEEARRYFPEPRLIEDYSDANEFFPYVPEQLEQIIKRYGRP